MDPSKVSIAIEKLEKIDPSHEYAYERAFLTLLSIKSLPAVVYPFDKLTLFRTR